MNILFVHQHFRGQYRHLARHLAAASDNQVVFILQTIVEHYDLKRICLPGQLKLIAQMR